VPRILLHFCYTRALKVYKILKYNDLELEARVGIEPTHAFQVHCRLKGYAISR
jgi:hypothetical protein